MIKKIVTLCLCMTALLALCDPALAQKKKKKKSQAPEPPTEQIISNPASENLKSVVVSTGAQVACYSSDGGVTYVPGRTEDRSGVTTFIYTEQEDQYAIQLDNFRIKQEQSKKKKAQKSVSKQLRNAKASGDKKQVKKLKSKKKKKGQMFDDNIALLQANIDLTTALIAEKLSVCNGAEPETPSTLTPFVGTVERKHAYRLLEVLGFGPGLQDSYIVDVAMNQGLPAALSEIKRLRADTQVLAVFDDNAGNENDRYLTMSLNQYITDIHDGEIDTVDGTNFEEDEQWSEFGVREALYNWAYVTNNSGLMKRALFMFNFFHVDWGVLGNEPQNQAKWWAHFQRMFNAAPDLNLRQMADDNLQTVVMLLEHGAPGNTAKTGTNHRFAEWMLNTFPGKVFTNEADPTTYGLPDVGNADLDQMTLVLTGESVAELTNVNNELELFPVFFNSEHVSGNKNIFEGTSFPCSADRLSNYLDCVFSHGSITDPSPLALFWSRMVMENFLTPNPDPALVRDGAIKLHENGFNIGMLIDDVALSAAFYAPAVQNTLMKTPLEAIISIARSTSVPIPVTNFFSGIRAIVDRSTYRITRVPQFGYRREDFANHYDFNRIRDGVEGLFSNNGYFEDIETDLGGVAFQMNLPTYQGVPNVFEILSEDLIRFVAEFLEMDPAEISDNAMAALSEYVLTYNYNEMNEFKAPYNGQSGDTQRRKGVGLVFGLLGMKVLD